MPHQKVQTISGQAYRICRSMSVLDTDQIGEARAIITRSTKTHSAGTQILWEYGHNSMNRCPLTSGNCGTPSLSIVYLARPEYEKDSWAHMQPCPTLYEMFSVSFRWRFTGSRISRAVHQRTYIWRTDPRRHGHGRRRRYSVVVIVPAHDVSTMLSSAHFICKIALPVSVGA